MARRNTEMFNLSFLDVLSGALGAIIFIFIITPKGGQPAAKTQQVTIAVDTLHNQVFGALHDSLSNKKIGDTLLVLITEFKKMPNLEDCPTCPSPVTCPPCTTKCPPLPPPCPPLPPPCPPTGKPCPPVVPCPPCPQNESSKYAGDPPSVPCKVSFEISWKDIADNVDLFVCKGEACVSGDSGKRSNKSIGQWDPGKSKVKLLGDDLRTTQEAVRQFTTILPGTYKLYAHFKESEKNNTSVLVKGLVYTRGDEGKEKGETYYTSLTLSKQGKSLLGTVELKEDGDFTFIKN